MSDKYNLESVFGEGETQEDKAPQRTKRKRGKKTSGKKSKTKTTSKKQEPEPPENNDLPWQAPEVRPSSRGQTQLRMHEPYHAKLKFLIEEFRPEKSQNDFIYKVVAEAVDKELQKRGYSKKDLEPQFTDL